MCNDMLTAGSRSYMQGSIKGEASAYPKTVIQSDSEKSISRLPADSKDLSIRFTPFEMTKRSICMIMMRMNFGQAYRLVVTTSAEA